MPKDPLGIYDDVIVIPFELPRSVADDSQNAGETERRQRDVTSSAPPPVPSRDARLPDAAGVSWPADEGRLVIASIRRHPSLVISGVSNGELTLWPRKTDTRPAEPLASLRLDRDGSLWDLRGQFVGRLEPDETAGLRPDWLRSITADWAADPPSQIQAGEQIDNGTGPASSIKYVEPEPPYDPPIEPVYPIEELAALLAGGGIARRAAWWILRKILAASTKRLRSDADPRSLDRTVRDIESTFERRRVEQLDRRHISAARRDLRGRPVVSAETGKAYNHLQEVRNAQRGLANDIRSLSDKIRHYERFATPQPRASIAKANRLLFKMRRFLRYTEKRVPPDRQPPTGPQQ